MPRLRQIGWLDRRIRRRIDRQNRAHAAAIEHDACALLDDDQHTTPHPRYGLMRMWRVVIAGLVIGVRLAAAGEADEPCREANRRAETASWTIVARPRAIANAGACARSSTSSVSGCVTGVVRHGATCKPASGVTLIAGEHTAVSDAAGGYRLCGLPAGALALEAPQAGVSREVRAGDVVDVDSTFLGDLGIPLAATSIVTFDIDRVVGAPLGPQVDIFVQTSPQAGPIAMAPARPSYELGRPLELRVARDPTTQVLVAETCWIRPAPATSAPHSTCAHCGAVDPSVFIALALLGLRGRRRCSASRPPMFTCSRRRAADQGSAALASGTRATTSRSADRNVE